MSSPISFASTELPYPVYEAEFDPYDRGYLVVSGGGGESKSGVPNRLTLIDVSSRAVIESVGEADLPTTEDCPTSTASLVTSEGLTVLVNASSGVTSRQAGQNDHLRPFTVKFPPKTKAQEARLEEDEKKTLRKDAQFESLRRSQLLSTRAVSGKYAHQNPIRLSQTKSRGTQTKRLGATASRDADASEIAIFDATSLPLDSSTVRYRITPDEGNDTEDLDIFETPDGEYTLAYCTASKAFARYFAYDFPAPKSYKNKTMQPTSLFSLPPNQRGQKLKTIRWLSERHVLLLCTNNIAKTAELLILQVDDALLSATIIQRRNLPKSLRSCATMDVCRLDSDAGTGAYQVVIAVGGSDGSIQLYSLDYNPSAPDPSQQITPLNPFITLNHVHDNSVCKLAFSHFHPPRQPPASPISVASSRQYIRLASLGIMSRKVVVESITLTSVPTQPSKTANVKDKPNTPTIRWVLSTTSTETAFTWLSVALIGFVVLIAAILFQRYKTAFPNTDVLVPFKNFNPPGAVPPSERTPHTAVSVAPEMAQDSGAAKVREALEMVEQAIPTSAEVADAKVSSLAALVEEHGSADSAAGTDEQAGVRKIVLVSPHADEDGAAVTVKEAGHEALEGAKKFGDLAQDEQQRWKERLKAAGHWIEREGVAVLEGVLFSEVAVDVGGGIRDAILG